MRAHLPPPPPRPGSASSVVVSRTGRRLDPDHQVLCILSDADRLVRLAGRRVLPRDVLCPGRQRRAPLDSRLQTLLGKRQHDQVASTVWHDELILTRLSYLQVLSVKVLYGCVPIGTVAAYRRFASAVVASGGGSRPLGPLVTTLVLNLPERRLWKPHEGGQVPPNNDGSAPTVGLPELLLSLPNLRSLGSELRDYSSVLFYSSLSLASPRLQLDCLYGVVITSRNVHPFVSAIGCLSSSLRSLRTSLSSGESPLFPVRILPRHKFPLLHSLALDQASEPLYGDSDHSNDDELMTSASARLAFAYGLLEHWSFPSLRQLQLGPRFDFLGSEWPDPSPFLHKNGATIEDFTCNLSAEEHDLVPYLLALPALNALAIRPFDVWIDGLAREILNKIKTLVIIFDENDYDNYGWLPSFFDTITRERMPLLEDVVWDSGKQDDDEDAVPCWKR